MNWFILYVAATTMYADSSVRIQHNKLDFIMRKQSNVFLMFCNRKEIGTL